jgi:hypothetical protein
LIILLLLNPVFGQNSQVLPTDKGTLNVDLSTTPDDPKLGLVKLNINFINPQNNKTQEHIDYRVTVKKDGGDVFGPIPLTHTSTGSVSIPVEFTEEGNYQTIVEIEGILFQPIPPESVTFSLSVGGVLEQPPHVDGGGCLIATATFGTELSPQIQQLREVRDTVVLKTESGKSFMTLFNQLYYSFSPTLADFEREHPFFKELVKISLTPMLTTLSILNHVDINSEAEMVGYGLGIIFLSIGMYFGLPTFAILKLYQIRKIR